jgi:hypothetical protein
LTVGATQENFDAAVPRHRHAHVLRDEARSSAGQRARDIPAFPVPDDLGAEKRACCRTDDRRQPEESEPDSIVI